MRYPHLFSEGTIGNVTIRNRTVLVPMVTGMANYDGTPSEQLINYYEERAKNGLGLLITGASRVNNGQGVIMPRQTSMASDRHIVPLAAMVDRLHAYGTKVFCQLHHPGNQGLSMMVIPAMYIEFIGNLWPGFYRLLPKVFAMTENLPLDGQAMAEYVRFPAVVSASNVQCQLYNQRVRALRRYEITNLVRDFVNAARRVQLGKGDGIELHAAHGYLLQQFHSPYTNRRRDAYGGSLENRMRFTLEIIDGIRRECGPDFPIAVRLTVDEFYRMIGKPNQGLELEEGVEIARRLEKAGVDAIDVSSATYDTMNYWCEPMTFQDGWRKNLARAVKEAVSVPVIAANLIRSPEQAEAQIAEGTQDFVGLGRPFLADPAWVSKAIEGRESETTRCISCLRCLESLVENAQKGRSIECAVNPRLGRERETAQPHANGAGRSVVVIGAGPAGLQAAEVCAARGFRTVVFEKAASAGGQLNLADKPPGKTKIDWCTEDLQSAALRSGAEIRVHHAASLSDIKALDPYAVLVAAGATPCVPPIRGVERENVCTVNDVLDGTVKLQGKRVAVIGSGLTGLETAEKLAADGNSIIVVEMLDKIGPGAYFQNLNDVLGRLDTINPEYITSYKLVEVGEGEIKLAHCKSGRCITREVDHVVLSVGVKSDNQLVEELKPHFTRVFPIGDAREPGRIYNAVRDAFDTAWTL